MDAVAVEDGSRLMRERFPGGRVVFTAGNGPVNSLSQPMRQALLRAVQEAALCPELGAAVFTCAGSTFHAGADLSELDEGLQAPGLLEFAQACWRAPQVLVAALHGTVYGGGLLVALACDWRVAEAGTRFAMPEVGLGLLPTFGGTQLLPRLVGVEAALRLIVDGEVWTAEQALEQGLVDEVVPAGTRVPRALQACLERSKRPVWMLARHAAQSPAARAQAFFQRRQRLAAPPEGPVAPLQCLEVMEAGLDAPLEEALAREHAAFLSLLAGAESRRLRRRFFGERALRRETFDREAIMARLQSVRADPRRLHEEACSLLTRGVVGRAEALDVLLLQGLQLPRHAPGPIEGLFARKSRP